MEAQQKQMIENYIQAYNEFDIDGMTKDLHEDILFENISDGEVTLKTEGLDSFVTQAKTAKQYFATRKQTIVDWKFQGDKVIIGIDYQGVLAIDLTNGMQAGDPLQLKGQSEFEFNNGKIIKITDKS